MNQHQAVWMTTTGGVDVRKRYQESWQTRTRVERDWGSQWRWEIICFCWTPCIIYKRSRLAPHLLLLHWRMVPRHKWSERVLEQWCHRMTRLPSGTGRGNESARWREWRAAVILTTVERHKILWVTSSAKRLVTTRRISVLLDLEIWLR